MTRCSLATLAAALMLLGPVTPAVATEGPKLSYASPEAAARADVQEWDAESFAHFTGTPSTAKARSEVAFGPIEYYCDVDTSKAGSPSIFDACVLQRDTSIVPALFRGRRIAEYWCERTPAGWQLQSIGEPSFEEDATRQQVMQGFAHILGGPPHEVVLADLAGSQWLVARRGRAEAAGFLARLGYGTVDGWGPPLPPEGQVLSARQFKALLVEVGKARSSSNGIVLGVAVLAALLAAVMVVAVVVGVVFELRAARSRRRTAAPSVNP